MTSSFIYNRTNFKRNSYLSQLEFVNKYNLDDKKKIPCLNEVVIEFPIKRFLTGFFSDHKNEFNLENVHLLIKEIKNKIPNDKSKSYDSSQKFLDALLELIDEDLLLTIEDRIFAPIYRQSTELEYRDRLSEAGFSSAYRVSKSPKFSNIRKIVSPFYKQSDNKIGKILYGDGGMLSFVVSK